jgi:indole-3-acetate monooxygenase
VTSPEGDFAPDPVAAAGALAPLIRSGADRSERDRRLAAETVAALRAAGLFKLCVPRRYGGTELPVPELLLAVEQVAVADGSAGWCAMIGATSGVLSGHIDEPAAEEIYGPAGAITGGPFAPIGRAAPEGVGFRLRGRWPFVSGCEHCTWLMGGAMVRGSSPRILFFPQASARIHDTWHVAGLCGTGSHDIEVRDEIVPAGRTIPLSLDRPASPGPLYVFPVFGLISLAIAMVAAGIARGAIDELVELAAGKVPTYSVTLLAERTLTQVSVARAEAELRSARALVLEAAGEAWHLACTSGAVDVRRRGLLRLAATHACEAAARTATSMYTTGGGSSLYLANPLQRRLRDVHAVTQHVMIGPAIWEVAGRVLLDLEPGTSQL